ncbi:MAG TPA: phosphoenolpyruvate carboxylase [Coleofasciculaceae cyanobacterium]
MKTKFGGISDAHYARLRFGQQPDAPPAHESQLPKTPAAEPLALSHLVNRASLKPGLPRKDLYNQIFSKLGLTPPPSTHPVEDDIRLLGALLGNVIQEQGNGSSLYPLVEKIRTATRKERRSLEAGHVAKNAGELATMLTQLTPSQLVDVSNAFRVLLTLSNIAETYQITQRAQAPENQFAAFFNHYPDPAVLATVMERMSPIRVVATAHPTEIHQADFIARQRDVFGLLKNLNQARSRAEQQESERQLKIGLEALWNTRFFREQRPTVEDEVEQTLKYFSNLYQVLPTIQTGVAAALQQTYKANAPRLSRPLFSLGSWVSGDMDGHPLVGPSVLQYGLRRHFQALMQLYIHDVRKLRRQAIIQGFLPSAFELEQVIRRLDRTLAQRPAEIALEEGKPEPSRVTDSLAPYAGPQELLEDLRKAFSKVPATSEEASLWKNFELLQNKIQLFQFHFASIDLREESENVQAAAKVLLQGSAGISPQELEKPERLSEVLTARILADEVDQVPKTQAQPVQNDLSGQPLQKLSGMLSLGRKAQQVSGPLACRNMILSLTASDADVLSALYLMKSAGHLKRLPTGEFESHMDVTPLFEKVKDLENAERVMSRLFENPAYRAQLKARGNTQIIMLGFSDGTKDGGCFANSWYMYKVQEKLLKLGQQHGIDIQFYYGRGGNPIRGGGSTRRAVQALPPGSIAHGHHVTEQGEVLSQHYMIPERGQARLENLLKSVIRKNVDDLDDASEAQSKWPEAMDLIAGESKDRYQALIYDPDFVDFFNAVTPEEIRHIYAGSRGSGRHNKALTVENLRAIPWVFRWFQTRMLLSGWYGLGSALEKFCVDKPGDKPDPERLKQLQGLYRSNPFFRNLLENCSTTLRQADFTIARHYFDNLVDSRKNPKHQAYFDQIQAEYDKSLSYVLQIMGGETSGEKRRNLLNCWNDDIRKAAWDRKEAYLDPLHHLQIRVLKEFRATHPQAETMTPEHLLPFTICTGGLVAGLGTSG